MNQNPEQAQQNEQNPNLDSERIALTGAPQVQQNDQSPDTESASLVERRVTHPLEIARDGSQQPGRSNSGWGWKLQAFLLALSAGGLLALRNALGKDVTGDPINPTSAGNTTGNVTSNLTMPKLVKLDENILRCANETANPGNSLDVESFEGNGYKQVASMKTDDGCEIMCHQNPSSGELVVTLKGSIDKRWGNALKIDKIQTQTDNQLPEGRTYTEAMLKKGVVRDFVIGIFKSSADVRDTEVHARTGVFAFLGEEDNASPNTNKKHELLACITQTYTSEDKDNFNLNVVPACNEPYDELMKTCYNRYKAITNQEPNSAEAGPYRVLEGQTAKNDLENQTGSHLRALEANRAINRTTQQH